MGFSKICTVVNNDVLFRNNRKYYKYQGFSKDTTLFKMNTESIFVSHPGVEMAEKALERMRGFAPGYSGMGSSK
jgi:hypothetical protein